MALPQGISRANFLHHLEPTDGVLHSITLKGGYQEMISVSERNLIPAFANSNAPYTGFTLSDDALSTGKRRVGMLVSVLEENKFYQLIPVGFFGNGGNLGETEWLALPEWERALRMDPAGTYCSEGASPVNGFTAVQRTASDIGIAADANSCWVEISLSGANGTSGVDGTSGVNGTSGVDGTSGISGIDGLQGEPGADGTSGKDGVNGTSGIDGTSGISPVDNTKIFNFLAPGPTHYMVGQDADYVGGSVANTNPILYVTKGETYIIRRGDAGHPLEISKNGNLLTGGIQSGSFPITAGNDLVWKVPQDASGIYTYKCTVHAEMTGQIVICCGDGVIAPDEPTPTPTAVRDEPTATPVPPTATPVPTPTPTAVSDEPIPDATQYFVNVESGLGDSDNSQPCEVVTIPVWSPDFNTLYDAAFEDTLFTDANLTTPFDGGAQWYNLGSTSGLVGGLKILVRTGAITSVADCPVFEPEPTATPAPEPTATPEPRPTATPAESGPGVQFYLDATDGNGNSNSNTCGPTDVPVWTSSFANINSILANNTESLFSDSEMKVPFSGGAKWYTISDIAGGATYQILVREGVINNIADCPMP